MKTSGGQIVAQALATQGIRHAFCVPGESYLPLLAALQDVGIAAMTCRHEGTASMAAEAMGRLCGGAPGLCLVTRTPGLTNAMAGIAVAALDATPLVVLAGQVPTHARGTQAFQEADLVTIAAPLCKHVEEVSNAAQLAAAVARACHVARSATPGPVLLSLPEDVLSATVEASVLEPPPCPLDAPAPSQPGMARVIELLRKSERPLLVAGGGPHLWTEHARTLLHDLGARFALPLVAAFRRQGLIDPLHEAAAGVLGFRPDPALLQAMEESDLFVLLGTRATAVTRQNLVQAWSSSAAAVVHVYPDMQVCANVPSDVLQLCATPTTFLQALSHADLDATPSRQAWLRRLHAAHITFASEALPVPEQVDPAPMFIHLREHLPPQTIVTSGAGNYALWLHRYFFHRNLYGQLAPVAGSMGYGLPAALAAKWRFPDRPVIAVAGDGCFQMTMADFATAVQYGLGIIVLVLDNGQLGTIRSHQLRHCPDRDCGLTLHNPDFAAFAKASGGFGAHVHATEEFMEAFHAAEQAAAQGRPALLHVHISPRAIAPGINVAP